jgi:hypothetical protein
VAELVRRERREAELGDRGVEVAAAEAVDPEHAAAGRGKDEVLPVGVVELDREQSRRNAGIGTERTWYVFVVPNTVLPLISVMASAISILERMKVDVVHPQGGGRSCGSTGASSRIGAIRQPFGPSAHLVFG